MGTLHKWLDHLIFFLLGVLSGVHLNYITLKINYIIDVFRNII